MAAKEKPITVYPDAALRKRIEAKAKEENRGIGPMVRDIVRRYLTAEEDAKQNRPA